MLCSASGRFGALWKVVGALWEDEGTSTSSGLLTDLLRPQEVRGEAGPATFPVRSLVLFESTRFSEGGAREDIMVVSELLLRLVLLVEPMRLFFVSVL